MKTKKLIVSIFIFIAVFAISIFVNSVRAESLGNIKITPDRNVGNITYKYQLYSANNLQKKNIWKLVRCNPEGTITSSINDLYCLRAGLGFTSENNNNTVVEYNKSMNMMDDYETLVDYFRTLSSQTTIFDAVNNDKFNAVMWVLDNMLLENASEDELNTYLKTFAGYTDEVLNDEAQGAKVLSRADIEAIQQLVIWYYTNSDEVEYNSNTLSSLYMNIIGNLEINSIAYDSTSALDNYDTIENIFNRTYDEFANPLAYGTYRQERANELYTTLITKANEAVAALEQGENYKPLREITIFLAGTDAAAEQPIVRVKEAVADVALRKFISSVNGIELEGNNSREPVVKTTPLDNQTGTTALYEHKKTPETVSIGDKVTYTIRLYNEGDIDAYITEVTDYLPEYLEYVGNENDNLTWWSLESTRIAKSTEYAKVTGASEDLTSEIGKNLKDVLIPAARYDSETGKYELSYVDIQITCQVDSNTPSNKIVTNIAQITNIANRNGISLNEIDRDSVPNYSDTAEDGFTLPSDDKLGEYTGGANGKNDPFYDGTNAVSDGKYFPGQEDDDDFEKILVKVPEADLSLRKFISAVDGKELTGNNSREPVVKTTPLDDKTDTTAIYEHSKKPLTVNKESKITYTIRVYNEGEVNAYVNEITDYLPEGLIYLEKDETNTKYGWTYDKTTRQLKTTITAKDNTKGDTVYTTRQGGKLVSKYDGNGKLDYIDVQVVCNLDENIAGNKILTNLAQITKVTDETGNQIIGKDEEPVPNTRPERDSNPDGGFVLPKESERPTYKDSESNNEYVPGQEDDDDFEKVLVKPDFDLALRKFITKVDVTNVNNRYPEVSYEEGKISYNHTKEPIGLRTGDVVVYTIRVYNEGEQDGYANEITDDVPEGLEFLPDNDTNKEYRWVMLDENEEVTEDVTKAKYIISDYLSQKQEKETGRTNIIKAFDKDAEVTETNPDYKDVKIAFKVTYTAKTTEESERVITNTAQISADSDDDIDSKPTREEVYNHDEDDENEDDIDFDRVKVQYFDLALLKWVSQTKVTLNGETTVTDTGHTAETSRNEAPVKIEVKESQVKKINIKYVYTIRVMNEGEIEGYVKEITDYIPQGLRFEQEDNPDWYEISDGVIGTKSVENTLLKPGEYTEVQVVLTWINGKDNFGLKTNVAEISQDYNEREIPDIDSTPNNEVPAEDDIDDAPVIITVKTGSEQIYIGLVLIILVTFAGGVGLIKKYVLE